MFGRVIDLLANTGLQGARAGDVIVAGQSNAVAKRGLVAEQTSYALNDRIPGASIWDAPNRTFVPLVFGVTTSSKPPRSTPKAFGPEWTMADSLRERFPEEPVRIVKLAKAATGLFDEWDPDGTDNLATRLATEVRAAGLRASSMAFLQGETDRCRDPASVEAKALALFSMMRETAGNSGMRVVWPLLSHRADNVDAKATDAYRAMQRAAQRKSGGLLRVVTFDTLEKSPGDNQHYSAEALLKAGRRIVAKCFD